MQSSAPALTSQAVDKARKQEYRKIFALNDKAEKLETCKLMVFEDYAHLLKRKDSQHDMEYKKVPSTLVLHFISMMKDHKHIFPAKSSEVVDGLYKGDSYEASLPIEVIGNTNRSEDGTVHLVPLTQLQRMLLLDNVVVNKNVVDERLRNIAKIGQLDAKIDKQQKCLDQIKMMHSASEQVTKTLYKDVYRQLTMEATDGNKVLTERLTSLCDRCTVQLDRLTNLINKASSS